MQAIAQAENGLGLVMGDHGFHTRQRIARIIEGQRAMALLRKEGAFFEMQVGEDEERFGGPIEHGSRIEL